jgi:hypothetical protein
MTILRGEIYLLLDEREMPLKPTDTVIVRRARHCWSNRGNVHRRDDRRDPAPMRNQS